MNAEDHASRSPQQTQNSAVPTTASDADRDADFRLSRWLVYFASGSDWSKVGEFVAADATSAIERAVEVFGGASAYRAEQIPWDAAPLWRPGK
jgi:hypothetical protein